MNITKDKDKVVGFAQRLINGVIKLCQPLGIPKEVPAVAQRALTALRRKDAEYRVALALRAEILNPGFDEANQLAETILNAAAKVLRLKVSERWTPVWGESGFRGNTQIPDKPSERVELLGELATFFSKRKDWEIDKFDLTVEELKKRADALKAAMAAVEANDTQLSILLKEVDRSVARLRTRLRAIINELNQVLAKDDPRWGDLGLDTPEAERAGKPVRERKAKEKSQTAVVQRVKVARRRGEEAKVRAEKDRVRAEKAFFDANKLQTKANESAAKAATLLAKANALEAELTKTAGIPQRAVQPTATSESHELGESALNA